MWRTEGWERPHRFVRTPSLLELTKAQDTDEVKFYQNEAYEAGADAMLKQLRQMGEHYERGNTDEIWWMELEKSGTWVFIPDEENEERNRDTNS